MEKVIFLAFIIAALFIIYTFITKSSRLKYIETYRFHPALRKKLLARYPHLSDDQIDLVFETLRDYFFMIRRSKRQMVSMPSQAVDVAWHEFILFTRSYKEFCNRSLGYFLHHTPTEAMKTPTLAQEGIKRAWRLACTAENIDPRQPDRLPIIFAIDTMLAVPDGFRYALDCSNPASPAYGSGYCASDIGCTSGCGGDSGGSDGGSCSGGCGGD